MHAGRAAGWSMAIRHQGDADATWLDAELLLELPALQPSPQAEHRLEREPQPLKVMKTHK